MANKGRLVAIAIIVVVSILSQAGLAIRAEVIRAESVRRVCDAVEEVKGIIKDQQATNFKDPLVAPPGSPEFVQQVLDNVNERGTRAAKSAIARLSRVDCE